MEMKKILLVGLILLAILTVGAVSASDDADFNETLTVEETQEVSSDISFDDSLNDVGQDSLSEGEITENNFGTEVASHEYVDADWDPDIVNVWGDDNVRQGRINITVVKDGNSYSNVSDFGENENVVWQLNDLKGPILNEIGTYTIFLKYLKDETEVDLGQYDFTLTQFNINTMEGELYKDYPFDIIKIYDDVYAEVYVNDGDEAFTDDWTLSGLGIDSLGEYNITLVTYQDEDVVDNYTFTVNVVDEIDGFVLYTPFNVQSSDLTNPVLYLYSPEGIEGNLILDITNDENGFEKIVEFDINSNWMSWTLENLGIEENSGYNVNLLNGTDYITEAWLNVEGFEEQIITYIWDEDEKGKLYDDYTGGVISVEIPDDKRDGNIVILVDDDDEKVNWEIDGNDYGWSLSDLDITEAGEYAVTVKWIVWDEDVIDFEQTIAEGLLNVTTFNNDVFRAVLDKDEEILKIFCFNEGKICIIVEREDGEGNSEIVNEIEYNIPSEDFDNWKEWTLQELGFEYDGNQYYFGVSIVNVTDEEDELYEFSSSHSVDPIDSKIWDENDVGVLYQDNTGCVLQINIPDGVSGKLEIIVDGVTKYTPKAYSNGEYRWTLETLGITTIGNHDVKVTLEHNNGFKSTLVDKSLNIVEFGNDTTRAKKAYLPEDDEEPRDLIFVHEGDNVTIVISIFKVEYDDEGEESSTLIDEVEINVTSDYYNKWVNIDDLAYIELEDGYYSERDILCNGESLPMEDTMSYVDSISFFINDDTYDEYGPDFNDNIVIINLPFDRNYENTTINITSGDYSISIKFDGRDYEWGDGYYVFSISQNEVNSFDDLSDRDVISFVLNHERGKLTRWDCIEKNEDGFALHSLESSTGLYGDINAYGLYIAMEISTVGEDEADGEDGDEGESEEVEENPYFAVISIPDLFNLTDGVISVTSKNNTIFSKDLTDFNKTYSYNVAGYVYKVLFEELNLDNVEDKDLVNVTLTSNDQIIKYVTVIHRLIDGNSTFYEYWGDIIFDVHYGELSNPEYGMGISDGSFIYLNIPDVLDINEGNIIITLDDGTVLLNKTLNSFEDSDPIFTLTYSNFYQGLEYTIMANETIYSHFPENENITFSFVYANNTISRKGIVQNNTLYKIIVPLDVTQMFEFIIPDDVLVNGSDFGITISSINANRQSIDFDLGGGYFSIYINGVKLEDLGRLNRYDGETELELFRLCSSSDGVETLSIHLADLNITANGVYNIKVTHTNVEDEGLNKIVTETEIYSQNITLTSNVKVDNVTSDVFTGFGMDPILLYLDTYYGDINETSGKITVLNSDGREIFTSNIKSLSKDDAGRYYLKYSDFDDKNFGNSITVMYSDGNERSGNTTVNVTWKDVDSDVFNPVVNDDVDDYYGDFINLEIPDLLTTGQIIVTLKFKGNHTTNLPMNVTTDFGSQAVYRFNVADIKTSYPDGFKLSLSDLGFYEDDGNYDVDVKFTANGEDTLDVTNNTLNVAFSSDIIISINETLRYTYEVPFASVKVFEPTNAYVDLYIDGVLYLHKTVFEDGLITFTSSRSWTPGNHTAEIRVVQSEFDRLLNSSAVEFNVLTQTEDVNVSVSDNVKENEHVIISITVPKAGNVTIDDKPYELVAGLNTIDLGTLAYGNHIMWVLYEEELDDGNITFYNNYVSVFVGDDGHWLSVPDPLVLKDEDTININLGEGVTGYVLIYVDEKLIANRTLKNGAVNFTITDEMFNEDYNPDLLGATGSQNKYGKHTYRIVYSGDATHDSLTQTGEFTIAYLFKDDIPSENPLKEN